MPNIWLIVPDVPMPVPPLVIGRAVARVNEEADKAPVNVPPPCELIPEPAQILPLTPMPPVIINAPEVEDVEFVFEAACTVPRTVKPVPTLTLPDTPKPPNTIRAPVEDEVDCVLKLIPTPEDPTVRFDVPETEVPPTAK
jgi:hypothetical protein